MQDRPANMPPEAVQHEQVIDSHTDDHNGLDDGSPTEAPNPSPQDAIIANNENQFPLEDGGNSSVPAGTQGHENEVRKKKKLEVASKEKNEDLFNNWHEDKRYIEQMWSVHLNLAPNVDKLVKSWKGTADGILLFTGLFSATVAAFAVESLRALTSSSSDPPTLNIKPSRATERLNILWLFSLCISVSCALCAVIMQQWARRLERLCSNELENHYSLDLAPDIKARRRLRLISTVGRHRVSAFINSIMSMLHAAVFLFFAGLVEFVWPASQSVGEAVLILQCAFGILYFFFTVLPLIEEISVIQTPITIAIWQICAFINAISRRIKALRSDLRAPKPDVNGAKPSFWRRLNHTVQESPNHFFHRYVAIAENSFAKYDSAMTSIPPDIPIIDAELKGLLSTFDILRAKNVERPQASLGEFRAFLLGLCSLISEASEEEQARNICDAFLTTSASHQSSFSTWESWLIFILRSFDDKPTGESTRVKDITQFIPLCMRLHWLILLHSISDESSGVFERLDGWACFEEPICAALEELQKHVRPSVALSSRCLQACLAADIHPYRVEMNEALLLRFVSAPESIVNPRSFDCWYSPGDKSLLVIIGLVYDAADIVTRHRCKLERTDYDMENKNRDLPDESLSKVLSTVIKTTETKIQFDPPLVPITLEFAAFCHNHRSDIKSLGIEPALNNILACLGQPPLPPEATSPPHTSRPTSTAEAKEMQPQTAALEELTLWLGNLRDSVFSRRDIAQQQDGIDDDSQRKSELV